MRQLYITTLTFILLTFSWSCREEPFEPITYGSIVGEVISDTADNTAIVEATISTNPPSSVIFTDSLGRFSLDSILTKTYTLRVEKKNFITELESVTVFANQTSNVIIRLRPDSLDNTPPVEPYNPMPADGSLNVPTTVTLEWAAEDEDENDVLTYDVHLFNANQTESETVATDTENNFIELVDLNYDRVYFWQIVVKDGKTEVFSPVWSFKTKPFPDNRFLYAKEESGKYDIFSSDALGNSIKLTHNTANNWRPKMNPGRNKIAYISNSGLEPHLYLMGRDGGDPVKITNIPLASYNILEMDFCWSPDGTRLMYMNGNKLYTVNADGTGLQLINEAPEGFVFTTCHWISQNERILVRTTGTFNYNSEMYILDANGVYVQRIVSDEEGSIGGGEFSIDGNYVLYTKDVSGFESPDGRQLDSRIFLLNLSNLSEVDLSHNKPLGTNDLDPHFSPDGSKIIFVNTNNDGISQKDIYVMELDGYGRTLFFEDAEMPEWK